MYHSSGYAPLFAEELCSSVSRFDTAAMPPFYRPKKRHSRKSFMLPEKRSFSANRAAKPQNRSDIRPPKASGIDKI